jgi:hypothetical protein
VEQDVQRVSPQTGREHETRDGQDGEHPRRRPRSGELSLHRAALGLLRPEPLLEALHRSREPASRAGADRPAGRQRAQHLGHRGLGVGVPEARLAAA